MSDKTDIWMPLFIGDYLSSTSRLSTEQHGAYLLLIMDYWKNGPLPDNDAMLAQICRLAPDAWSMHRAVLEQYFVVSDGKWKHGRIERELADAYNKKRKAKDKAKAAAEARWAQEKDKQQTDNGCSEHATSNAQAVHKECPSPSPSPSPSQSKSDSKDIATGKPRKDAPKAKITKTDLMTEYGLPEDLAVQFIAIRKDKRQTLTPRAMAMLVNEFDKAGLSIHDGIAMCCDKSWAGFKSSWDWKQDVAGSSGAAHTGFAEKKYTSHIPDWAKEDS